jgi:hypothetical protein
MKIDKAYYWIELGFICKYPYPEPKTELSFSSYGKSKEEKRKKGKNLTLTGRVAGGQIRTSGVTFGSSGDAKEAPRYGKRTLILPPSHFFVPREVPKFPQRGALEPLGVYPGASKNKPGSLWGGPWGLPGDLWGWGPRANPQRLQGTSLGNSRGSNFHTTKKWDGGSKKKPFCFALWEPGTGFWEAAAGVLRNCQRAFKKLLSGLEAFIGFSNREKVALPNPESSFSKRLR